MGQLHVGPKHLLRTRVNPQQQFHELHQMLHEAQQEILRLGSVPPKIIEKPVDVYRTIEVPKEVKVIEERIVERIVEVPKEIIKEKIVEKLVEVPKEVPVIQTRFIEKLVEVGIIPPWVYVILGLETFALGVAMFLKIQEML